MEVEKVLLEKIHKANAITIHLPKEQVNLWADEEIRNASNAFLLNTAVAFIGQRVWLKPKTKTPVLGEVVHIYPAPKNHLEPALIMRDETSVNYEGLPENRQKVIDFNKIGGLSHLIDKLREIIQIPVTHPDLLAKFGIKPPKGLLMYGPPGNGKTMIARAVAQSMGSNFITIDLTDALSQYVGQGEKQIREKFEQASARGNCVIFIDEIDAITSIRTKNSQGYEVSIVSSFLSLMDGLNSDSGVFVIGATNRLNAIDPALRRPGRFDLEFEVPLPAPSARLDILTKYVPLDKKEVLHDNVNIDFLQVLSELTTGYSGADISLLYREAVMNAIRRSIKIEEETGKINLTSDKGTIKLSPENFLTAIKYIKPTSLRNYETQAAPVAWDELIAFDKLKVKMMEIHELLAKNYLRETLCGRQGQSNVIFAGAKGSGKRTLAYSFAKQYNYEVLTVDILDLFSLSLSDASHEIENVFIKAKQIAPSIIFIKNIEKVQDNRFYYLKILNELEKLNNRHKIITIMQFERHDNIPDEIIGYKGFENIVDFDTLTEYNKYDNNRKIPVGQYLNNLERI
ncbi:MAG: AAA family ATPase [Tannerella sp.]|nr:AAA family ATPase [Tannerella sp.]